MIVVTDLEVVFDNAGGVVVQCDEYAHCYDSPSQAWRDVKAILDGDDTADWEGNNEEDRWDCTDELWRSGGCRVYDLEDILQVLDDGEIDSPWGNVRDFFRAAGIRILD